MRVLTYANRSLLTRATITVGVIACLCFSIGEGLRLTPFPVSPSCLNTTSALLISVTVAPETSLQRYGPINVPSHAQCLKRGKRHTVDCEFPPPNARRLPGNDAQRQVMEGVIDLGSPLPISQLADRAPPVTA